MQWESLVDGSYSKKQEKKPPELFQLSDLPADLMPDHRVTGDTANILAALSDESGDEWLNCDLNDIGPIADNTDNVASTKYEDLIDLTAAELLGLFVTYNPTHGAGLKTLLENDPKDSEDVRMKSETPSRIIRRARDINWD